LTQLSFALLFLSLAASFGLRWPIQAETSSQ